MKTNFYLDYLIETGQLLKYEKWNNERKIKYKYKDIIQTKKDMGEKLI